MSDRIKITYVGGPTILIEYGGVRLLTDPTFDPAGDEYKTGPVTLRKLAGPVVGPEQLGWFDYVLLSHDHHFDNLDHAGRAALAGAKIVFTTTEGAARLGGNSQGLKDWERATIPTPDGRSLQVIAAPARHGPEGLHRGAVNGFILCFEGAENRAIYISGDTVWYSGVAEVAQRFGVRVAILHLGGARVPEVGPYHLTMTADEGVEAARHFPEAAIVPIHFEDWAHFSDGREATVRAFDGAKLSSRVRLPERGRSIEIDLENPLAAAGS